MFSELQIRLERPWVADETLLKPHPTNDLTDYSILQFFNSSIFRSRVTEVIDDETDLVGGEELGVLGNLEGGNPDTEVRTVAYPAVETVHCHMGVGIREVEHC